MDLITASWFTIPNLVYVALVMFQVSENFSIKNVQWLFLSWALFSRIYLMSNGLPNLISELLVSFSSVFILIILDWRCYYFFKLLNNNIFGFNPRSICDSIIGTANQSSIPVWHWNDYKWKAIFLRITPDQTLCKVSPKVTFFIAEFILKEKKIIKRLWTEPHYSETFANHLLGNCTQ